MAKLSDTAPEAQRVLIEVFRNLSMGQKWLMLGENYRTSRVLHAAGYRLRHPTGSVEALQKDWLVLNYGFVPELPVREPVMDLPVQNLAVVREVANAFDRLAIPYALGGSMASSLYGIDRFTKDADITAEPFPDKESDFVACFNAEYYVSRPAVHDSMLQRSCFNIIQTCTGFKVDIFIRKDRAFEQAVLGRRRPVVLPDLPEQPIMLVSPEDILLLKLDWYRLGGGSSDQQWADILAVLTVQAERLDAAYLEHWATELGVGDLLARARKEAFG
jgi:hypothetical protein